MTALMDQWRLVIAASLAIGLGTLAILQTSEMSELGRVFPMTASLVAIAAGLGVLVQLLLRWPTAIPQAGDVDFVRAGLLSVTLLVWALSLDPLGFIPACAIAVVVVAVISRREPMSLKSIFYHAVAGVILVVGFSLLLSEVLNVRLP